FRPQVGVRLAGDLGTGRRDGSPSIRPYELLSPAPDLRRAMRQAVEQPGDRGRIPLCPQEAENRSDPGLALIAELPQLPLELGHRAGGTQLLPELFQCRSPCILGLGAALGGGEEDSIRPSEIRPWPLLALILVPRVLNDGRR